MTDYLEFKDGKSSKFWMIALDGATHTVTYGKIGTDGRSTTKEFDTGADARESAHKLLESKLKKGYERAATSAQKPHAVLTNAEAAEQFDLEKYDPVGCLDYERVIVVKGDMEVRGSVDGDTVGGLFYGGDATPSHDLIIIDGNLTIHGSLELTEYYPCLLVLGDLRCEVLSSVDGTTHITGDAFIERAFFGNYNDGGIDIDGTTHVPYLFNGDHGATMSLNPKTVCFNYYSSHDDFFEYDYYPSDLPELLKEEFFEFYDEEVRDEFDFDWWSLRGVLKRGESPFLDGKAPEALSPEDIRALAAAGPSESPAASTTPHEAVDAAVAKLTELHKRFPAANVVLELASADDERLSQFRGLDEKSFQWQRLGRWLDAREVDTVPKSSFDYFIQRYGSLSWFLTEEAEDVDEVYTFRSNGHAGPTTPLEILPAETYPILEDLAEYEDNPDYLKLEIFMADEECNGYAFDTRFVDDSGEALIVNFEGHDDPYLEGDESQTIQPFGFWLLDQVKTLTEQLVPWMESTVD